MTRTQQLEAIRAQLEDAKQAQAMNEVLDRLERNRDYKKLVSEGFLKDHVLEQTSMIARPDCQHDLVQQTIQKALTGASAFNAYMASIRQMATAADERVHQCEQAILELENMTDEQYDEYEG